MGAARLSPAQAQPRRRRLRNPLSLRVGRPKILFVCSGLNIGGAERQWSILIPGIRDRGFDVSVLTLVDEGPFFDELLNKHILANCARMRSRSSGARSKWS